MTRRFRYVIVSAIAFALLVVGIVVFVFVVDRDNTPRIDSLGSVASLEQIRLGGVEHWRSSRAATARRGLSGSLRLEKHAQAARAALPAESAHANVVVVTDGGSENFGEVEQLLENSGSLSRVLAKIDIISSNFLFEALFEAFWRQLKHGWLFLNTLDSTEAVRRLVAFYAHEHNEKIPRAVLGGRTPDEVYFGREENLLEHLACEREKAQRVRSEANRAASCHRCDCSRARPGVRSVAKTGPRRKPARKSA